MRSSLHRGSLPLALIAVAAALPQAASAATESQTMSSLRSIVRAMPSGTSVYAHEAATNTTLVTRTPTTARVPASVTKVFTASTALMLDGPATKLPTIVRMEGTLDDAGTLDGDLIVIGDGDPGLRLDQLATLADAAKERGIKKINGGLRADVRNWTSQQGTPITSGAYNREVSGRIGALVTLRGYASATVTDPARQVLVRFRAALKADGIGGSMPIGSNTTAGPDTALIGQTTSPTIGQLVASTLAPSDNFYAEMLLRGVGARHGGAGTTQAGLVAERTALAKVGVSGRLYDGSGLSHSNRVTPVMVVKLLDAMAKRPEAAALRTGMALAGSTGTVAGRMRGTAAAGRCRVKTGTLSNVSALAGYCTTLGKREVTFAVLNNTRSVSAARTLQDRVASALASWTDAPEAVIKATETPKATAPLPTTPGSTPPTTPVGASGGV